MRRDVWRFFQNPGISLTLFLRFFWDIFRTACPKALKITTLNIFSLAFCWKSRFLDRMWEKVWNSMFLTGVWTKTSKFDKFWNFSSSVSSRALQRRGLYFFCYWSLVQGILVTTSGQPHHWDIMVISAKVVYLSHFGHFSIRHKRHKCHKRHNDVKKIFLRYFFRNSENSRGNAYFKTKTKILC